MDTPTPTPLQSALGRHADSLLPAAREQLASLWQAEFESLPASVADDLVAARLSKPEFSHFKKPVEGKAPAAQQQQAPVPNPYPAFGARGVEIAAASERFNAGLKASVGAGQLGGAPGLAGNYK